ncbi:MAG: S9 family peptidase [Gammaproteobacteria bacterium]|nr:S9 family peptidase [Gammaproteobacteria bacterium]
MDKILAPRVIAVACLFLALACAASIARANEGERPAIPEKLPAEVFGRLPFVDEPALSPLGDRVAARINSQGVSLLGVLDLRAKAGPPTLIPTGKFEILWTRWAGNDRLLIGFLGDVRSASVKGTISRLMLYDLPKNELRYLAMKAQDVVGDNVIHVAEDGSFILVSVARDPWSYPNVFRVDLASGEWVSVVPQKRFITTWVADSTGVVKLGSGVEYRKIKWVYRESPDDEFKTIGKLDMDVAEAEFNDIRIPRSGQGGFVLSNARTGRLALYEFDLKKFELGKLVFGHPTADLDSIQFSDDGSAVEGAFYTDDRHRVVWFDGHMKEVQKEIDDALKGRVNLVTGSSKDRSKFIVWTGTANDPGHYYFYDRDTGVMTRLGTQYDALKDKPLAPVSSVSYRSRDGLEIPSYLTLPVGRNPRNLPLVVMPHGGPFARDSWRYDPWVQFLANRGYAILQPNFRGSTGYGRDYLEKGFGQYGTGIIDDISSGVRWLISEGIADPARVCIMGASFGGYAAMWGAITAPQLYRCAISFAGVTDIRDMMSYDKTFLYPVNYRWLRHRIEGDDKLDLDTISPVRHADQLEVPLLLVHGTADRNVPFRQAEKMARALKNARKPFEFVKLKDVRHGFRTDDEHTRFLSAVDAFLAKYNPAD